MAGSCGAFCAFCGKCGRKIPEFMRSNKPVNVPPPGTAAPSHEAGVEKQGKPATKDHPEGTKA